VGMITQLPWLIDISEEGTERGIKLGREEKYGVLVNSRLAWETISLFKFSAKTQSLKEAKVYADNFVKLINLWFANPYEKIQPTFTIPEDLTPWLEEHNEKAERYPCFLNDIAKDRLHFQSLSKSLQQSLRTRAIRLSIFPKSKANALKTADWNNDFQRQQAREFTQLYTGLSKACTNRGETLTCIIPTAFRKVPQKENDGTRANGKKVKKPEE